MNKFLKKTIKYSLYPVYKLFKWGYSQYGKSHPLWLANQLYKKHFGRNIDWGHPTEMNEKIRWMQFNTDTSKWTELADKYLARDYVARKGYGDILIPLLGMWKHAEDIDFGTLPDSFVIKTNHGSGDVIVVKDKNKTDLKAVRKKMRYYLERPYGHAAAELHYLSIKPRVLAEKLLVNDGGFSSSMVDYKFYCINGKPYCCAAFYDRDPVTHHTNSTFYDMQWHRHDEWRSTEITTPSKDIPRPKTLDRMIQACHDLVSQFPFVRLDFYESGGKLYFGEFTFTPAALNGGSLSKSLCRDIGELMTV